MPVNEAVDVLITTNLIWTPASLASEYIISVGTTSGGVDIVDSESVLTNEYDFTTDLLGNTKYFVTITPKNIIGEAVGCLEESFTTETAPDLSLIHI